MGRSWHESWVSGEGRVDRAGSDDESRGKVLPRGATWASPKRDTEAQRKEAQSLGKLGPQHEENNAKTQHKLSQLHAKPT
jgi:hypothetical protein